MTDDSIPQTRWNDEFLDSMRQVMDPPADDVVRRLYEEGEVGAVNRLMKQLVHNDELPAAEMPAYVSDFLAESARLPDWMDEAKIKVAEDFFACHGPLIGMALQCASLPECYANAKAAQVLHLTARLETDAQRRIGETAQMIIDAMSPGGLAPGGAGIRDAQKVRLMHAAVRHLALASGQWNAALWDQPVNQEDLAATLVAFTRIVVEALKKLGAEVQPEQAEAYLHAWKVVGHILGIKSEMLPANMDDAGQLVAAIRRRHFRPSPEGQALTAALVQYTAQNAPGHLFDGLPATMIRYLLGDQTAEILGAAPSNWTGKLIVVFRDFFGLIEHEEDESKLFAKAADHFGLEIMSNLASRARGGQRAPFNIPLVLQERWGINDSSKPDA